MLKMTLDVLSKWRQLQYFIFLQSTDAGWAARNWQTGNKNSNKMISESLEGNKQKKSCKKEFLQKCQTK